MRKKLRNIVDGAAFIEEKSCTCQRMPFVDVLHMSEDVVRASWIYQRMPLESCICHRTLLTLLKCLAYARGCRWTSSIFIRTLLEIFHVQRTVLHMSEDNVSVVFAFMVDDTVIAVVGEACCRNSLLEDTGCPSSGQSGSSGVSMKTIGDVVLGSSKVV